MRTKKHIALLVCCSMLLGCLTACDSATTSSTGDASNKEEQSSTTEESSTGGDSSTGGEESSTGGDSSTDENSGSTGNENKVILGNTTDLSGDFRWPGFGGSSAGASDLDISRLTTGYSTMESDQFGAYRWNETAVKSHTETENEDGTYTITITINEGLTFSDGSDIKAVNYVAGILPFGTPVSIGAGHSGQSGMSLVGFDSFHAYDGTNEGQEIMTQDEEGNEVSTGVTATKEFAGVRLIDDYTFSMTVSSDYYPYYFAYTYGSASPEYLPMVIGDAEIKDDGNGCYLTEAFYAKDGDEYAVAKIIADSRYDVSKYPFSGPYVISEWDTGTKTATLTINPEFKGNFEGQKPSIETVVYIKLVAETQLEMLKSGGVDVLSNITGGDDTKAALAVVTDSNGGFAETHYQRAGYGKVQFECDFGPTMFQEVRQAIAYLLNRTEFCQSFTGGYGVVVDGPYSPDFAMWQAVQDEIELIDYTYSPDQAVKLLEDGGWVYNSKGEAYEAGQSGVDAVRYKKLTAEEAAVLDGVNKNYASVANTDGTTYKTVEVNGEYYMPLAINWFGTTPNDVTDLLTTSLANSTDVAAAGMVIRSTTGDFDHLLGEIYREPTYGYGGTPTYGMFNLATGWNSAIYDYAFNWSLDPTYFPYSSNKLYDPYDVAFPYDQSAEKLSYKDAMEQSGGKLGMDYLSMGMVYNATTEEEYNEWWMGYIERWNELMPDIPLYSNYYYDVYNAKIENFEISPFFGPANAILYANVK